MIEQYDEGVKKQQILDELEPLFEKAYNENLWFYCSYQSLWFSPDELRKKHKEDKFIWGAKNWMLRNPNERLQELKRYVKNAEKNVIEFEAKLKQWKENIIKEKKY